MPVASLDVSLNVSYRPASTLWAQGSLFAPVLLPSEALAAGEKSFYDFTVQQYDKPVSLSQFAGKVTIVVNVASE